MPKQIDIKLLKAIETIKSDEDILNLWEEFAEEVHKADGWFEYLNSGWDHAEVFEDDIYIFLNNLRFYWQKPVWVYVSTTTLTKQIKQKRGQYD